MSAETRKAQTDARRVPLARIKTLARIRWLSHLIGINQFSRPNARKLSIAPTALLLLKAAASGAACRLH